MSQNRITTFGEPPNTNEMATTKLFGKDLSQYEELDIDDILEQLSPEELEMLAGEVDPDDSLIPPSERNSYKCSKEATGPLDRKKLIDHINDQAINEPDRPDLVPYVAGTVRGKKWVPPPPPEPQEDDDAVAQEVEVDLDEEFASVLNTATEDEIVDLAAILGFHSMMNQEQYHASLLNKGRPLGVGWGGITKATKFKALPVEPPNDTDVEDSIKKVKDDDSNCKDLNFNNIRNISDEQLKRLFEALESNTKLESLSMANVALSDRHLDPLCNALSQNNALRTLNLETNNISPAGIVRIMESLLKTHCVEEVRLANQRASVLGNKIEMQLTEIIEQNPSVLRVGIHFEFNDARNRVSKHLQKNLDTFRVGVRVRRASRKVATEGASLSFVLPSTASPPASPLPYSPYPQDKPHAPPAFNGGGQRGQEQDYEDDEEDFDSNEE
ncbi:tropomodulin-like isoform X3 [Eriocheir sinensis]|uniref:tropomodulin-like isoform X3 n=1 Tax=Eriocheir sinensis TaxID=95602 RepID=UPI0021C9B6D6|nr:tropomodulin-like isoform X3 [Eriocheir sinensis]